jgi:hypothetical protein
MRMCPTPREMYLVRRSLGPIGCGVKERNGRMGEALNSYFMPFRSFAGAK